MGAGHHLLLHLLHLPLHLLALPARRSLACGGARTHASAPAMAMPALAAADEPLLEAFAVVGLGPEGSPLREVGARKGAAGGRPGTVAGARRAPHGRQEARGQPPRRRSRPARG